MLKAIIFDADSTLYNVKTKCAYSRAADFLSKKTGIPADIISVEWKDTVDKIKSSPEDWLNPKKRERRYALKKTLLGFGLKKQNIDSWSGEALKIFWDAVAEDLEIFPEVIKTIEKLGKNYTLAIASEEFRVNLIKKLNQVFGDWKKYFKILITPEITGTMKPSGKYYIAAMKKFHLSYQEILAVGDSEERDLRPAQKLGIKTIKISPCELGKLTGIIPVMK